MSGQDRAGFLGGSDAAAILGISPWASPYSVWAQKVGLYSPDDELSADHAERLAIGQDAEVFLARVFERRTGLTVAGEQMTVFHPQCRWLRGRADGLVFASAEHDIAGAVGGLEIKTARDLKPWDEVPAYYQAQAQLYMALTRLDTWWFVVGFAGWKVGIYVLQADRSDQALILWRMSRFWRRHVVTGVPPEVDGHDATTAALGAYEPTTGEVATVPDALVDRVRALTAEAKALGVQLEAAKNQVRACMGSATEARSPDGVPLATWRLQASKRVAGLADIAKARPELVDALDAAGLIRRSTTRVLLLKETKK